MSCQHKHKHNHDHNHKHHGEVNEHMNERSFEDLVSHFESPERDAYQDPEKVITAIGNLIGKKVMDLGAGTGYFSFRMAGKGADVIAADADERFIEYLDKKIEKKSGLAGKVTSRKTTYDDPSLSSGEIDVFFTCNVYHHIENRVDYFKKVWEGTKPGGKIVIVDFRKEETEHGPPVDMRISSKQIIDELTSAGFSGFSVNDELLKEQIIVMGVK
jgi:2-polyprenyl-3-methyl-5-hydroxy-6-metoxy-1,4-benzoquinol methylase